LEIAKIVKASVVSCRAKGAGEEVPVCRPFRPKDSVLRIRTRLPLLPQVSLKLIAIFPQVMEQTGEAGFLFQSERAGEIGGEVGDVPQVVGQRLPFRGRCWGAVGLFFRVGKIVH